MTLRSQLDIVDQLIADDESRIAELKSEISQPSTPDSAKVGIYQSERQILISGLLTLEQGLEGLRLKHDSLLDLHAESDPLTLFGAGSEASTAVAIDRAS